MPWNLIISLVILVVSAVITALSAKGPAPPAPPSTLADFQIPQIDDGTPQAVAFGDVWVTGWQVLWYGNLQSEGIPPPDSGGKK